MAKPQTILDQEAVHGYAMVKELLAELQTMDDKARVEAQFYELIDCVSHSETPYQNEC
jgi:hypothetical protein